MAVATPDHLQHAAGAGRAGDGRARDHREADVPEHSAKQTKSSLPHAKRIAWSRWTCTSATTPITCASAMTSRTASVHRSTARHIWRSRWRSARARVRVGGSRAIPFSYVGPPLDRSVLFGVTARVQSPWRSTAIGQKKRLVRDGIDAYRRTVPGARRTSTRWHVDHDFHRRLGHACGLRGAGEPGPRDRGCGRQGGERPRQIPRLPLAERGRGLAGASNNHFTREVSRPDGAQGLRRLRRGQYHGRTRGHLCDQVQQRHAR